MANDLTARTRQAANLAANPEQGTPSIGSLVQNMRGEIARALPKHLDADRLARITLTVLRKNPALTASTPESFMGALLTCAQLGLEPGPGGEAYLVPYQHKRGPLAGKTECQLIIGYQGYTKLFWQSPLAQHLDAHVVYEGDDFDYAYGLEPFLRHKPLPGGAAGRKVRTYYAVASLKNGAKKFVVVWPEEVKELRGGKVGPSGGIADPMRWMERKTALRQLFKTLPSSTELTQALEADEKVRTDLDEDAIDLPMVAPTQIEQSVNVPDVGTVDTSTGEIQDDPADAEWLANNQQ